MKIKVKCDICNNVSEFVIKQFSEIDEKGNFRRIHPNIGLQTITTDKFAQLACKQCKCPIAIQMSVSVIQNAGKSLEKFKNKDKKVGAKKNERNRK